MLELNHILNDVTLLLFFFSSVFLIKLMHDYYISFSRVKCIFNTVAY